MTPDEQKATTPDPFVVEIYRQAHETRRKWEGYIWQWGLLLTVMVALLLGSMDKVGNFALFQKLILSVLTLFLLSVYLNVRRARELMKVLETSIRGLHGQMHSTWPTVPLELDLQLKWHQRLSSTKVAAFCHLCAFIIFLIVTIMAWVQP